MDNKPKNQPPAEQSPAVHQQPNVVQNEGLVMNLNENPMANENVAGTTNNPVNGEGNGVGSEITDGEGG